MKILMVYPLSEIGGVETWIKEVSRLLELRGHEVIISEPKRSFKSYRQKKMYIWFKYKPPRDVDVIHLHEFSWHSLTSGKPIISTYHGSSWGRFTLLRKKSALISGFLEKLRYSLSDINVVVSREAQRWLPHSIYIPNGVNPEKFKPMKKLREKNERIKIIWRGRISPEKGYYIINELKKYFDFIEFPYVPYEKLPLFYNSADVFVLPSFYEGMPLTVLEAMACGLPVVAFRVGGLPDCVFDDINGYLVKPGNLKELIEKIKLAYENKERLGKNGRLLVEKIFNWKYVVDRYIELYEEVARR
jgi:glycosyltransferase involved in cell wall biosynthesis